MRTTARDDAYDVQVYAEGYLPREVDLMVVEQHPTLLNVTLHPAKVGAVSYASPSSLMPHWPLPSFATVEDSGGGWRWTAAAAAWWWSLGAGGAGGADRAGDDDGGQGGVATPGPTRHQFTGRYPTPAPRAPRHHSGAAPAALPPRAAMPAASMAALLLLSACRLS